MNNKLFNRANWLFLSACVLSFLTALSFLAILVFALKGDFESATISLGVCVGLVCGLTALVFIVILIFNALPLKFQDREEAATKEAPEQQKPNPPAIRGLPHDDPAVAKVTGALRAWIVAEDALRRNPQAWKSSPPPPEETEAEAEYARMRKAHYKATADLWMTTDFEYDERGFRDKVWWWRYWKVQARKCCFYQLSTGTTDEARKTMALLHKAEAAMVEACGLTSLYRSPCSYLEEQFPGLKAEAKQDHQTAS